MAEPKAHKPRWTDACGHTRPRDRYLGSFEWMSLVHDVYVYQDNALAARVPDMHVCFRYGERGDAYASPGNASDFVRRWDGRTDVPKEYEQALLLVKAWMEEVQHG